MMLNHHLYGAPRPQLPPSVSFVPQPQSQQPAVQPAVQPQPQLPQAPSMPTAPVVNKEQQVPAASTTKLSDFKKIKFLGKGTYGSVCKVVRVSSGKIYALKEVDMKNKQQSEK